MSSSEQPATNQEGQVSPIVLLQEFVKAFPKNEDSTEVSHASMVAAVRKIAADYNLDDAEIPMLLCSALITESNLETENGQLINQVEQYGYLFNRYVKKSKHQKKLLSYIFSLYKQNKKHIHYVSLLLQQFYNEYLLDSAVFREWNDKKKEKTSSFTVKFCAAATPFLNYLNEAESS